MNETFLLSNIAPQVGVGFNRHCTFFTFFFLRKLRSGSWYVYAMLINSPRRVCVDWAYLEDWCRRLTNSFADVYVFTIPLYLPQKDRDGKSRVVSGHI
jgi:endonuclease G, mitochondrial